ncbi:hypothetical protein QZH41_019437 [Actinostola sp. cb2023]|nr:hypothetical protein QZH41_019437 [Actinostola sp. cb2023]
MVVLQDPNEDQDDILRVNRSREKQYVFDHSFGPVSSQNDVYKVTTKPLIENVVTGYNATVFAYGATGAGKTYTMLGSDNRPGIMGLTLNDLFAHMESTKEDVKYKVTMSYLEIYNEMIRDLLNPTSGILDLREDTKGVNVAGLSDVEARTTSEVTVSQKSRVENVIQEMKVGKFFMIDLAGSERAAQTKNRGKRMIEGAHINRSLLALGNCINALSENRGHYVNFRDSKLTRLLKDSLGGNCKTVMIAHVSPAGKGFEESRNTMLYADRAKNIKTTIKRNQFNVSYHITQYTSIIADLRKEIFRLKTKIAEQSVTEPDNNISKEKEQFKNRDHTEMTKLRTQLVSTFREQMEIRHKLMELEDVAMQIAIDTNRYMLVIDEWEQEKARRIAKTTVTCEEADGSTQQGELLTESTASSIDKPVDKNGKTIWTINEPGESNELTSSLSCLDVENKDLDTEKTDKTSEEIDAVSIDEPEEVSFARDEIDNLIAEEKKVQEMKVSLQNSLLQTRKEVERLEELLPQKISSEENREILGLICKVHELEISNAELQSHALLRENVLRYKDLVVSKYESRQKLCDEIIQMQRAVITESQINCSSKLEALYEVYQQQSSDTDDRESVSSTRTGSQLSLTASSVSLNRATVLAGINRRMTSRENLITFTSKLSPLTEETPSRLVSLQNSPTKKSRPTPSVCNTVLENPSPDVSHSSPLHTPRHRSRASSPVDVTPRSPHRPTVAKEPNNDSLPPMTPVFSKTKKFADLAARRRMLVDSSVASSDSLRNDDVPSKFSSLASVRDSDRDSLRDRPAASNSDSSLGLVGAKPAVKASLSMTDLSVIDKKAIDEVSVDSVPITRRKAKKAKVERTKISTRPIKRQRSASLDDVKVHRGKSRHPRKGQLPEGTRNYVKQHQVPSKIRDRVSFGLEDSSPSRNSRSKRSYMSKPNTHQADFLRGPARHKESVKQTRIQYNDFPDVAGLLSSFDRRFDPASTDVILICVFLFDKFSFLTGELQSFVSNITPPSTVQQYGTPPGKGLTLTKKYRAPSDITGSDSNQSTPRLKPRKHHSNANQSVDGLSVSGVAVRPERQYAGTRRF